MTRPETTKRADARRNREKLLNAAGELFATVGTEVSLDAVAKGAGVGIGTLYRHFPTRDALVEAAYRAEVEHLCEAAEALLKAHPPDVALERWMERFVAYAETKKGMRGALTQIVAGGSDVYAETRVQILSALGELLAAGVEAGVLRSDVTADDIWRAMGPVWSTDDRDQIATLLKLLMDGLRHTAA
ncbi:TetR/AcrR family transcriptional regulator [Solirubrobacter soli]|uniref:TetR/AcrR family transcriptional regulator n=1 Tax=Solirubrobacter soli TaxID=363832 RepID=UPI00040CA0E2|nr:TetR/AcrR family transcriptional regulator [Solirubrobacter soli]